MTTGGAETLRLVRSWIEEDGTVRIQFNRTPLPGEVDWDAFTVTDTQPGSPGR